MGSSISDLWEDTTSAVTGWWDDLTDVDAWRKDPFGNLVGVAGGPAGKSAWNGIRDYGNEIGGKIGRATGLIQDNAVYDLSDSGTKSAASESDDPATSREADTAGIPAVAQSISSDAANAIAAQNSARKRAKGILSTYTRFGSDTTTGKTKLGE